MNSLVSEPILKHHRFNSSCSQSLIISIALSSVSASVTKLSTNVARQLLSPLTCSVCCCHIGILCAATSRSGSLPAAPADLEPVNKPTYLFMKTACCDPTLSAIVGKQRILRKVAQTSV